MRKFTSDRSGKPVVESDLTTLKIVGRRSPLRDHFGAEVHLTHAEAAELLAWLRPDAGTSPKPRRAG